MIESAELNYTYSETAQMHPNTNTHTHTSQYNAQDSNSKTENLLA